MIHGYAYTLVDTSIWIDYFKGIVNAKTDFLEELIKQDLAAICPVIIQEVLQGISDSRDFAKIKGSLLSLHVFTLDNQIETAIESANIYRSLRKKGLTIRKSIDCIIAYYCIHLNLSLLHSDRDFDNIASELNLKVISTYT